MKAHNHYQSKEDISPCLRKASPKKLRNFTMTQIMNLTPFKNRLLHFLVPLIATFVPYFLNVVPIFWWRNSDFEKILISGNICNGKTYIVWHCYSAKQCTNCHKNIKILKKKLLTVQNNLILLFILLCFI